MKQIFRFALYALLGHALAASAAAADTPQGAVAIGSPPGGVAFDERLDRDPILLPALPRTTTDLPPLIVRIALPLSDTPAADLTPLLTELDRRLTAYAARNVTMLLRLGAFPETEDAVEPWRQGLRTVAEHGRGKVLGYQVGTVVTTPAETDRYVYLLKIASVQLRSTDPGALVIQGSIPADADAWQAQLYAAGIAPYVDGVAILGPTGNDDEAFRAAVTRMTSLVDREDPTSTNVLGPMPLADAADLAERFFNAQISSLGTSVRVTSYDGDVAAIRSALAVAQRAADLFNGAIVTVDEKTAGLRMSQASTDVTSRVPHKLLFSTSSFATFLVYGGTPDPAPLDVDITITGATTPQVRDAVTGTVVKPSRQTIEGSRISLTVPAVQHPLILDFNAGAIDRFVLSSSVEKETLPAVGQIIARHQQVQAAQDAALGRYTAHLRLEQHFRPSPADAAWNVVTENRMFVERGAVEWEEQSFSLNGATWTTNRPPFPLVQPEKVLSLPLDLRLTQDYTYRLDGVDTIGGRPAYVVRFDPTSSAKALYRGTVWIDRREYVRLKVQAVETQLSGMVVSNDETQTFTRAGELQGRSIWLLDRLTSKQMFLMAGRTVLIEREAHVTDVVLAPEDFESVRREAHASNRIMYRDTEQGLRYLVKKGETRVVANQMTTSTKAFALGAQVDPSFDYPLPIGGLNILDFNFLNKDMQFALLFAGVFGAGNIQKANMWGGRFDASVDFFYLAAKSNDSLFDASGERTAERVRRMPASAGLNLGYQATPFQKLTGHYEFRFDGYSSDPKASAGFVVPSSVGTQGIGAGYEYRRAGYSFVANAMEFRRTNTASWGFDAQASPKAYRKFDVGVSKDFIFSTFHTIHVNGTYFGGDRLDRFSMYQFGMFDPARMHGVPSAVRFAELAMFRGGYSFNLFDQYRVDLFVDHARGRDAGQGPSTPLGTSRDWVPVTGVGLGLNLRAPRSTILRVDFGRSFLPDVYRGAGSTTLQIMLLKPL